MPLKQNTIGKIMLLLLLMFGVSLVLYNYSNQASVRVIQDEIEASNLSRLSFFATQIDNMVNQLSVQTIVMSRDKSMEEWARSGSRTASFSDIQRQESVVNKLNVLSATSVWSNQMILYLPRKGLTLSSSRFGEYDPEELRQSHSEQWVYQTGDDGSSYYSKFLSNPLALQTEVILETRFSSQNIVSMLDAYKKDSKGDPFLYVGGQAFIGGTTADEKLISGVMARLEGEGRSGKGHFRTMLEGEDYIVFYTRSEALGALLADYVPLEQTLSPIVHSRNLFYAAMGFLLLMVLTVIYILHKQVNLPIRLLVRGVERLMSGQLHYRLGYQPRNEFENLFIRFNEMAEEIQRLVEKVYLENIRFRDAKLKQLQAQINPHFLYNTLFFIKNMIVMDEKQTATGMVMNLADYYRYITRMEHTFTSLAEELEMVAKYLDIQQMRSDSFHYEVDVPHEMLQLQVPRLIIQPIVENCLLHGFKAGNRYGIIQIEGRLTGEGFAITIDDNGVGMREDQLQGITDKIRRPVEVGESSFGLWNVHQRMLHQYKEGGLLFSPSPLGGLRVTIHGSEPKG
ncbi:sensor histidine kinase [Paenibacillus mucilaginosus]|uniref:Putative sensor with HAMP domain n=1 Tax=Paenibacillus mucilaginosus (strain KNP414) TaxID=1036673 RepID=F8FRE6_PAEMK|nr:sensor histidine kinase [Paenibacillus mucilaginosus]AEI40503.1 putative sensor with HAMP domain [Paenibacillus mucilaginosus KNP414]MCG7213155.1 sensor histidine kinase [Paenibacillus mucilaginosus]WDM29675.1 sensor histidine kinase [Paenibacillus mucilaginosus]